jgi:uncharacterized protein YhhL (DUF1145 family)
MILAILKMFGLVVLQNASFTLVSRARNSDSYLFHGIASTLSNGIWLLVFRNLVQNFDSETLMFVYLIASVTGSVGMHYISMKYFEKKKKSVDKIDIDATKNKKILSTTIKREFIEVARQYINENKLMVESETSLSNGDIDFVISSYDQDALWSLTAAKFQDFK